MSADTPDTKTINDGGPAFPVQEGLISGSTKEVPASSGMSLRDYFAAKVMQGMLASGEAEAWTEMDIAVWVYEMADAMLAARGAHP